MGWLALIVAGVILVAILASMGFVFGERLLRRVQDRFNDSIGEPLHKPRRVRIAGRDHVCEFGQGSIFCAICGKPEE